MVRQHWLRLWFIVGQQTITQNNVDKDLMILYTIYKYIYIYMASISAIEFQFTFIYHTRHKKMKKHQHAGDLSTSVTLWYYA